jgi:hypothetical protein
MESVGQEPKRALSQFSSSLPFLFSSPYLYSPLLRRIRALLHLPPPVKHVLTCVRAQLTVYLNCCWASPAQRFLVQSPTGLIMIMLGPSDSAVSCGFLDMGCPL